jgi:hypothetical protein
MSAASPAVGWPYRVAEYLSAGRDLDRRAVAECDVVDGAGHHRRSGSGKGDRHMADLEGGGAEGVGELHPGRVPPTLVNTMLRIVWLRKPVADGVPGTAA